MHITNEAGMLTFIGDDDYGIMKGDGFADLDEVLSTIKFKVIVVSR